jgi:hypothetical protein
MAAVWRSVFVHEFLDGNPANFRAVPGQITVLPGGLAVHPTPRPEDRGFPVRPGHSLTYEIAEPFQSVIGADIALDIFLPAAAAGQQRSGRVILGGGAVRLLTDFLDDLLRLQLFVGSGVLAASLTVPASGPLRVRTRWHTHGQAHVWLDGALRAYEPALAAGASFTVDRVTVGHHATAPAPDVPEFLVRRVGVKLLRPQDASNMLDQVLPIDAEVPLDDECARQVAAIRNEALAMIRQFMMANLLRLTQSWREGQAHAPFTPEAVAAHESASAAAPTFIEFLKRRRDADREQFLAQIGRFLAILAAADPTGYAQLVAKLEQLSERLEPRCRAALEPFAAEHGEDLAPLAALFQATWARIQTPGGPDG